jgi:hypothetical protein
VDVCLDRGGSFDYARSRCDFAASHPGGRSYVERHPVRVPASLTTALLLVVGAYFVRDRLAHDRPSYMRKGLPCSSVPPRGHPSSTFDAPRHRPLANLRTPC